MAKVFATDEFRTQIASWQNRVADPNSGAGTAGGLGSVWDRNPTFPTVPLETYFKEINNDNGWARQNLVNLRVFNLVRDFGAVPDGVTDCTTAIRNALAAADLVGGGIIYLPPDSRGYAVYRQGVQEAVIPVVNRQNIVFMGDGYNSWIKFTGDTNMATVEVFRISTLSQRIGFFNLRMNADTLTNFGEQTHWIQVSPPNPAVADQQSHDVDIQNIWFDAIRGDCVRLFGGDGSFNPGYDIWNTRVTYCTFNTSFSLPSRAGIVSNRDTNEIIVRANWFNEGNAQSIDWEPGGGDGPRTWNISDNIFETPNTTITVTLSGVSVTQQIPSRWNIFGFNIMLMSGSIYGLYNDEMLLIGNIMQHTTVTTAATIELRNLNSCGLLSNLVISVDETNDRSAIWLYNDNPGRESRIAICDNLIRSAITLAAEVPLRLQDTSQCTVSGNLVVYDRLGAVGGTAVQFRAIEYTGEDWVATGNLVLAPLTAVSVGIDFATLSTGQDVHNIVGNDNFTWGPTNGLRFRSDVITDEFLDGRACRGNNCRLATVATVSLPNFNEGVTTEGSAGPAAQMAAVGVAAGPNGNVIAPNGSFCTNTAGAAGTILWTKDTGTGDTGWAGVGQSLFVFGTIAGSVATAARFLAPGSGQLTESTVEISMLMPRAGTLRNMRIDCVAGVGGGNNTYTLRVNGANSILSILIANTAATAAVDTSNVAVAAGDRISMQVTKTVAPGTPQTAIVISVELN